MQQFQGNSVNDADCSVLRELSLQRLSHTARIILALANDMSLERLVALADQVVECALPGVSSDISPSAGRDVAISRLECRVEKLVGTVKALQLTHHKNGYRVIAPGIGRLHAVVADQPQKYRPPRNTVFSRTTGKWAAPL